MRPTHERIVALQTAGIFESHYLKLNHPDGGQAAWLKHTLLRPLDRPAFAEFWAILFERGQAAVVAKQEVPWSQLQLAPRGVGIDGGGVRLDPRSARGALADLAWDLRMTGGLSPLLHFRHDWMYRAGFPRKKVLTPAPNLQFDGRIQVGETTWEVDGWRGHRGHNWGRAHAHHYAYGSCNLWDDGAQRAVDGFSARVHMKGRLTPWLSGVVGHHPFVRQDGLRHLAASHTVVQPTAWSVGWNRLRGGVHLHMTARPDRFVGLRYASPDGHISYCYNTKHAHTELHARGGVYTSNQGELELLAPTPTPGIPLHPTPDWDVTQGPYRSSS